jgi:hypothetical protein
VWRGLSLFSQVGLSWVELDRSELWWLQNGYNLGPGFSGLILLITTYQLDSVIGKLMIIG